MEIGRSGGFRFTVFGAWMTILFLTLPLLIVVPVSFTPQRYLSLPGPEWSLRHYAALLDDPTWMRSIRDSLIVASRVHRARRRARHARRHRLLADLDAACPRLVRMLMLAPMIVPTIVHALGFYQGWVQFGLIDTYAGLILAHAMKGMPYVVISVSAALANVDLRLEQAARNLGATMLETLRMVIVPAARPGHPGGRRVRVRDLVGRAGGESLHHQPQRLHVAAKDLGRHSG